MFEQPDVAGHQSAFAAQAAQSGTSSSAMYSGTHAGGCAPTAHWLRRNAAAGVGVLAAGEEAVRDEDADPSAYLGSTDAFIDVVLRRAQSTREKPFEEKP